MPVTQENVIVLYLGSHKIVAFEGTIDGNEPRILRHAVMRKPEGFEKGFVTNIEQAAASIQSLLKLFVPARESEGLSCYVVLGNSKLNTYGYSSSPYFQGVQRTITAQDIRQVVDQTRSVATLPLSEFVLQAFPESFMVNDTDGIRNPLRLEAHRLGVNLKIYTMNFQDFKNLVRVFEALEIEVAGFFPNSLTVSEAVLKDQEKEDGVILVDMADDSTQLILWKGGNLCETRALSGFGGVYLSNQMAAEWGIDPHDAQKVKERYASLSEESFGEELIPLVARNGVSASTLKRQIFHEKFCVQAEKWLAEIFAAAEELAKDHKIHHPYYVLTGGGSSLDGLTEFTQKKFSKSIRLGRTAKVEAAHELLVDLSLCGALGMFRWLGTNLSKQAQFFAPKGFIQKTLASARDWFFATF